MKSHRSALTLTALASLGTAANTAHGRVAAL